MTTTEIPTTGECAHRAWNWFLTVRDCEEAADDDGRLTLGRAAVSLLQATFDLLEKFPDRARREFAGTLPFSGLELQLLQGRGLDDQTIVDAVANRIDQWANRSPVFVDEASVHVTDFLEKLSPNLDLWEQRQRVGEEIARLQQYARYR